MAFFFSTALWITGLFLSKPCCIVKLKTPSQTSATMWYFTTKAKMLPEFKADTFIIRRKNRLSTLPILFWSLWSLPEAEPPCRTCSLEARSAAGVARRAAHPCFPRRALWSRLWVLRALEMGKGCHPWLDVLCNSIVLFSLTTAEHFHWANKARGNEKHAKFKGKRSPTFVQETNVINYPKCRAHRYLILRLLKIRSWLFPNASKKSVIEAH